MWSFLKNWFSSGIDSSSSDSGCDINPATGLPMIGGCGGVDVEGNPYGTDINDTFGNDDWSSSSPSDDSFSSFDNDWSSSSSWDD